MLHLIYIYLMPEARLPRGARAPSQEKRRPPEAHRNHKPFTSSLFASSPDGKFATFLGHSPFLSEHFNNTDLEAATVQSQAWYRGARSRRECAEAVWPLAPPA